MRDIRYLLGTNDMADLTSFYGLHTKRSLALSRIFFFSKAKRHWVKQGKVGERTVEEW